MDYTNITENSLEELNTYGKLDHMPNFDGFLYHLDLPHKEDDKFYSVSFVKCDHSWGGENDQWEAAVIGKKRRGGFAEIKGIIGFLTEDELMKYVRGTVDSLDNPEYFEDIPKHLDELPRKFLEFENKG